MDNVVHSFHIKVRFSGGKPSMLISPTAGEEELLHISARIGDERSPIVPPQDANRQCFAYRFG
jgi:hypothetical protein